jgi:hypothetical protein
MALINYTYGFLIPFLLLFSIPLTIFAAITTTLACSVLLFRVLLVYAELAVAVIPHYLLGLETTKQNLSQTKSFSNPNSVPLRRRKRHSSGGSGVASAGSITPVASDINIGLSQSVGPQRDFEGVGGWRLDVPSEDESLWTSFNSRLELPADHVRRHRRSLTSGSMPGERMRAERSYSPEATMMSPNTSRARTPPTLTTGFTVGEGYFQSQPASPKVLKKTLSNMTSTSLSSGSSKGSSGLTMKQQS